MVTTVRGRPCPDSILFTGNRRNVFQETEDRMRTKSSHPPPYHLSFLIINCDLSYERWLLAIVTAVKNGLSVSTWAHSRPISGKTVVKIHNDFQAGSAKMQRLQRAYHDGNTRCSLEQVSGQSKDWTPSARPQPLTGSLESRSAEAAPDRLKQRTGSV